MATQHGTGGETSLARTWSGIANPLKLGNSGISFITNSFMETEIKAALISLLSGIKQADGRVIAEEMSRLDDFLLRGRGNLHPQLVHFLERRSYAKAVMFLGGETDIPVGACGGRPAKS